MAGSALRCTKFGLKAPDSQRFCEKCGGPVAAPPPPPLPPMCVCPPPTATTGGHTRPTRSGGGAPVAEQFMGPPQARRNDLLAIDWEYSSRVTRHPNDQMDSLDTLPILGKEMPFGSANRRWLPAHDFRPLATVSGHSKASATLDIYAHINQQVHRDRAARMEQLLLGEPPKTPELGSPTGSPAGQRDVGAA